MNWRLNLTQTNTQMKNKANLNTLRLRCSCIIMMCPKQGVRSKICSLKWENMNKLSNAVFLLFWNTTFSLVEHSEFPSADELNKLNIGKCLGSLRCFLLFLFMVCFCNHKNISSNIKACIIHIQWIVWKTKQIRFLMTFGKHASFYNWMDQLLNSFFFTDKSLLKRKQ